MALLKAPDCGVAVMVMLPDPPDGNVKADGLAPKVNPLPEAPAQLDVYFTAADI